MGWRDRERGGEAEAGGGEEAEVGAAAADLLFAGGSLLSDLSLWLCLRAERSAFRAGDADGERDDDRDERFTALDADLLPAAAFGLAFDLLAAPSSSLLEGGGLGLRVDDRPRRLRPSRSLRSRERLRLRLREGEGDGLLLDERRGRRVRRAAAPARSGEGEGEDELIGAVGD